MHMAENVTAPATNVAAYVAMPQVPRTVHPPRTSNILKYGAVI